MTLKITATTILAGWMMLTSALALTPEEILLLKQNGVSETTIQMMLQSEIEARRQHTAGEAMGTRTIIRPDGRPAIVYSTGSTAGSYTDEERLREARAWEMLRHIIVDTRQTGD